MRVVELQNLLSPLLTEISEINREYDFGARPMSHEIRARWEDLWEEIRAAEDEWDLAHPVSPCPECHSPRKASLGGVCTNFPQCDLAPPLGG